MTAIRNRLALQVRSRIRWRWLALVALVGLGAAGPAAAQDADGDSVLDAVDNCVFFANANQADADDDGRGDVCDNCSEDENGPEALDPGGNAQLDANLEGFGNRCDSDYTNDGVAGGPDFVLYAASFERCTGEAGYEPETDQDGDGCTEADDFAYWVAQFGSPPGPSGLACAGTAPCPVAAPVVSIASPGEETVVAAASIAVSGTVSPADTPVTVNGQSATVTGTSFSLSSLALDLGSTQVTAQASSQGATASDSVVVIRVSQAPPAPPEEPEPEDVDPTVATSVFAATGFLYTGQDPIQSGVDAGAIVPDHAVHLRGYVGRRDGTGLGSVEVSVKGHPELGETLSRASGLFDLVVNGGGAVVLEYRRAGYLPVHRTVESLWGEARVVPDVVMIPVDPAVTGIELGSSGDYQVAQGSPVLDIDGPRRATLLVPPGTTAQMIVNGSPQSLSGTIGVRATEYTVGQVGPETMPAELPPTSAYTYAAELSVDEALAAGASRVVFNQPIPFYVENFLGFDVGETAPLGSYDFGRAAWVPEASGVVLEIVSITGDRADLNVDGDPEADTGAALTALGITDGERDALATLYEPGDTLWRVASSHFTPIDINWPPLTAAAPEDAVFPDQASNLLAQLANECGGCPTEAEGSIIRIENRGLMEAVPVVGTPWRLVYSSERVPGRRLGNTVVQIPLIGPDVPPDLLEVEIEVQVAGRRFRHRFAPQANLVHEFDAWDGRDAFNRAVFGQQTAVVHLSYLYDATYGSTDGFFTTNYGAGTPGASFARRGIALSQVVRVPLGLWNAKAAGLGGWTLDVHHAWDPNGRILYLGSGASRTIGELPRAAIRFSTRAGVADIAAAPDGGVWLLVDGTLGATARELWRVDLQTRDAVLFAGGSACGGSGQMACLPSPVREIAVATDGSLYLATDSAVKRVVVDLEDPDATTVTDFAGGGEEGFGPKAEVDLDDLRGLAVSADGVLFVAEHHGALVKDQVGWITPDDLYRYFAGDPGASDDGEGGAALAAGIHVTDLDRGPDGSLYVAGPAVGAQGDVVRRIFPDGRIQTVAGPGSPSNLGDGGLATGAWLGTVRNIAVAQDGTLYIGQGNEFEEGDASQTDPDEAPRLRVVSPEGTIRTLMGNGAVGSDLLSQGQALASDARPLGQIQGLDVAPDGSVLVATLVRTGSSSPFTFTHRTVHIRPAFPGVSGSEFAVPSSDRRELYVFNADGKHLRTESTLTGAVLLEFEYQDLGEGEPLGPLVSITELGTSQPRVTAIARSGGVPTAIEAPFGPTTELGVDAAGYLAEITNPAAETFAMTYAEGGLLTEFERPSGEASSFTWDSLGRLERDEDAAGGFVELASEASGGATTVTVETAEGTVSSQRTERDGDGRELRDSTDAAGHVTTRTIGAGRDETTLFPDGTEIETTVAPGRFGLRAPLTDSMRVTVPEAGTLDIDLDEIWDLDENDEDLETLTDTITVNNTITTRVFTAAAGSEPATFETTTPEGRTVTEEIDPAGRTTLLQVEGLLPVELFYDEFGRLEEIVQGSGGAARSTVFAYDPTDGFLPSVTDAMDRTTSFDRDAAGRVTTQTLPDDREVGLGYDDNGNLTSLIPPGRPEHDFVYTAVDLESEYAPPDLAGIAEPRTFFDYDLDRNLVLVTRPDGQEIELGYDVAGRLAAIEQPGGTTSLLYADGTQQAPGTGQLAAIEALGGQDLSFEYDGFLLASTTWSGTIEGSVSYGYDNFFRPETETVGASSVGFEYDDDGLLVEAGVLLITRHADHGLVTATTLVNVTSSQAWSGFGELSTASASGPGGSLYSETVSDRDALGRIITKVETIGGTTTTTGYGYDLAGRLETVTVGGTLVRRYRYDENGNRESFHPTNDTPIATYDAQDRMTAYAGASYTYTDNGELMTRTEGSDVTTYATDVLGNLRSVELPSGDIVSYVIDGMNRRVGKFVDEGSGPELVQGFLYRDALEPVAELDGEGDVVARFVYGTKPHVPDYMVKGGQTFRIVSDHLGSVRLVVNASTGDVAQRIDYDEFGNPTFVTGPADFQPFGFAGGLYDPHTGLVRFGARDYDPETGRWTSKDPIRFAGGDPNLYRYVLNDPVNLRDPSGMVVGQAIAVIGIVAAFVATSVETETVVGATEEEDRWVVTVPPPITRGFPGAIGARIEFSRGPRLPSGGPSIPIPTACELTTTPGLVGNLPEVLRPPARSLHEL